MPLWKAKLNIGHGTGHGVGYYLCMVTSDEPALYREGMHGIRHENLLLCREAGSSEFGEWLDFETLTCCHIDTSAVIPELLDPEALVWLNEYNAHVYRTLAPLLPSDVALWLQEKTAPINS